MKNTLTAYLKVFFILQLFFVLFAAVSCLLPSKPIKKNIEQSIRIYEKEHIYPQHFIRKPGHQSDNFMDFLIINMIYNGNSQNLVKNVLLPGGHDSYDTTTLAVNNVLYSINNQNTPTNFKYGRYWQGSTFAYRFLFVISDLNGIRWISFMVCSLVIFAFVGRIGKTMKKTEMYALLLGLIFVNYYMVFTSFQFAPAFLITLIGSLALIRRAEHHRETATLFLILGSIVCYFDLLTAPVLTLGIPLLIWVIMQTEVPRLFEKLREIIKFSFLWLTGFAATWMFKWLLIFLFTDYSIMDEIRQKMSERTGVWRSSRFEALRVNIDMLELVPLALTIMVCAFLLLFYFNKTGIKKAVLYFTIAFYPLLWFFATANHVEMHNWFTYRALWVTISGILLAFASMIKWESIKIPQLKKKTK